MSILGIVSVFYSIYLLIKIYISFMQIGFIKDEKMKNSVLLSPPKYIKAAEYSIENEKISIVSSFLDGVMFFFWLGFGLKFLDSLFIFESEILKAIVFVMLFFSVNFIVSLPISIYSKFVIDEQYGFNKSTPKLFLIDTLKGIGISLIIGSILISAITLFINGFQNWWIIAFLFVFLIIILINFIYPTVIAPIFNKFEPLKNDELQSRIEKLLDRVGFKSEGIFTIDASKRDARLNAYFGGFGKSKRVVLFDTLIEKLKIDEIIAVLGHELGHFKHNDIYKNIATSGAMLFLFFGIFGNLPFEIYSELGVQESPHIIISLFMILTTPLAFFLMPLMSFISRNNEFKADQFGVSVSSKEALSNALIKLVSENKSFPKSHPLYIFFYYSHPPILNRLEKINGENK